MKLFLHGNHRLILTNYNCYGDTTIDSLVINHNVIDNDDDDTDDSSTVTSVVLVSDH